MNYDAMYYGVIHYDVISYDVMFMFHTLQIEEKMFKLVTQYGIRLWKLRVTEAEIKATIR